MGYIILRYLIGFVAGLVFGLVFPTLLSTWLLMLSLIGVFVVVEAVGQWGFGHRYHDYRRFIHLVYSGAGVAAWFGILFGSGKMGTFFVTVGELISR